MFHYSLSHLGFVHIFFQVKNHLCHTHHVTTLALGLRPKKGHEKVWAESATQELHLHSKKCKGMNPHIPKWTPTLGVGIPMESLIFKEIF
jgi:hypothetical protein